MLTIDSRPEFVPPDEWATLLERMRGFQGGYNVYAVEGADMVLVVCWDFSLHRWDPAAGAFVELRRIGAA